MKKMKSIHKLLLLAVTALMAVSCGKYDDGPAVSFRSSEKRLIGLWEFSSIKIDGIEYITNYYNDSTNLKISMTGTRDEIYAILVEDNRSSSQLSVSLLGLNDKNTEFTMGFPVSPVYTDVTQYFYELIPAVAEENTWSIRRLSSSELWISTTFQDQVYDLQLSKLEQYIFNQ